MKKIIDTLMKKTGSKTYRDFGKVMTGTLFRNFIRGILKLVVAGIFAPAILGIFNAVYALFRIVASLADFGLEYAMVTMVSAAIKKENRPEKEQLLKIVFCAKLTVALVLLVVGNLFAPQIAEWALSDGGLTNYIRLLFFALWGQMWWKFISNYFSAHQHFGKMALFLSTTPIIMFVSILVLIVLDYFNLTSAVAVYLLAPFVASCLWWMAVDRTFLRSAGWSKAMMMKLLRFSRWVYMANIASAARNNASTLLLKNEGLSGSVAAGELNAGIYGFGNNLANEVTVFTQSLMTVLLPKASGKQSKGSLRRFALKSYKNLAFFIAPFLLMMFLVEPLIHGLGMIKASYLEYLPSIPIFMVLYAGMIFTIATIPMQTVLYSMNRPQVVSIIEIGMTVVLLVGSIMLIPRYGSMGAAVMVAVQRGLNFICIFMYGLWKLRRRGEADTR